MKNFLVLLFIFALAISAKDATAQSFKVIVNEANATESLSKQEVSDIFLKTKTKWDSGADISPVDLNAQSATREAFSKEIHGRGVGAIRSHWQQAAFSGAGTAPLERSSDAEVVNFVSNNPGAIGYISASAAAAGVKILSIQ